MKTIIVNCLMFYFFIFVYFFFFSVSTLNAQRLAKENWERVIEYPSYKEGTYAKPVGVGLELVSFYTFFEAYNFDQGQQLNIEFQTPERSSFFLKIDEKRTHHYYRLESTPGIIEKGPGIFGPLKIDGGVLGIKELESKDLGILFRIRGDESRYFLPVKVHHSSPVIEEDSFHILYRLSTDINGGKLSIYAGEFEGKPNEETQVDSRPVKSNNGGAILDFEIEKSVLSEYEGWVTVVLSLHPRRSEKEVIDIFYFYNFP